MKGSHNHPLNTFAAGQHIYTLLEFVDVFQANVYML